MVNIFRNFISSLWKISEFQLNENRKQLNSSLLLILTNKDFQIGMQICIQYLLKCPTDPYGSPSYVYVEPICYYDLFVLIICWGLLTSCRIINIYRTIHRSLIADHNATFVLKIMLNF